MTTQASPNRPSSAADYPELYLIGVLLFNRGDHFESHEVWEALWKATPGPEREFLQGLIQSSVALCHYYNGNVRGSTKLLRTSLEHLTPFLPKSLGLDLNKFFGDMKRCFAPLEGLDPKTPIALDPALVPQIELDPMPDHWPAIPDWVYDEEHEPGED